MCNCYETINANLAEHNTNIASYFTLDDSQIGRPFPIETRQVETGRGQAKAVAIFASFCPFGGENQRKPTKGDGELT